LMPSKGMKTKYTIQLKRSGTDSVHAAFSKTNFVRRP
jgi:hypothetical protein